MRRVLVALLFTASSTFLAVPAMADEATPGSETSATSEPAPTEDPSPSPTEEPSPTPTEDPSPTPSETPGDGGSTPDDGGSSSGDGGSSSGDGGSSSGPGELPPGPDGTPPGTGSTNRTGVPPVSVAALDAAAAAAGNPITICRAGDHPNSYRQHDTTEENVLAGAGINERDIIPPFNGYSGKNWDAAGQATHDNGCSVSAGAPGAGANDPLQECLDDQGQLLDVPECQPEALVAAAADVQIAADSTDIKICHATNSNSNPYNTIPPANAGVANGHDTEHDGPIFPAANWGDIIEPYTYNDVNYPGQNWTAEGEAIYNNGCNIPSSEPVEVTAEAPTAVPPTCDFDGSLVLPTTTGVTYSSEPAGTGPGAYTVTATADDGYVLTGQTVFMIVVLPQLTGAQCETPPPDSENVKICHRTNSNTNPYNVVPPATAGVANGHDTEHEGPIWDPTLKAQGIEWGDIIEPYSYNGVSYPGQNWTAEGQAIFNAGCVVEGAPEEVTAEPPTVIPPTCDSDGILEFANTPNVTYSTDPFFTGPGAYDVIATAEPGFELTGQTVFPVVVLPQLTGEQCESPECPSESDDDSDGDESDDVQALDDDESDEDCDEDEDECEDDCDDDDDKAALLPDTGGTSLWTLLMGGMLTVLGLAILTNRGSTGRTELFGPVPVNAAWVPWSHTIGRDVTMNVPDAAWSQRARWKPLDALTLVARTILGRRV